jgi:hypothetical protein
MKIENPFEFEAYDIILATDFVSNDSRPWMGSMYRCLSGPIPFYDYANYLLTAAGNPGSSYTATLNGSDNTVGGITLHVPSFLTSSVSSLNALVQYWLMVDSLDVQVQVTVHGTQLYKVGKDQTALTPVSAPPNGYTERPQYSYGTDFIPTLTITNTNPSATIAATGANQGVLLWGNRYQLEPLSDADAEMAFNSHRFSSITIVPPNF